MNRIDCHTHIINENIRNEYFSRTEGAALVMQFPESILANPDTIRTVQGDPRLFLCPCVDLSKRIPAQLRGIEAHLDDWKAVGLKIYTSYQKAKATDRRLQQIYEFARHYRLTITFHTGLCSLVLPSDQDIEGSSARYIAKVAERYPDVSFVAAHMDDPRTEECCRLCAEHPNLFTDFSGLFEDGYESDRDVLLAQYGSAIRKAGCQGQILYGTDFCPPIGLTDIERFDGLAAQMFAPDELEGFYYKNALRAFPRLAAFGIV